MRKKTRNRKSRKILGGSGKTSQDRNETSQDIYLEIEYLNMNGILETITPNLFLAPNSKTLDLNEIYIENIVIYMVPKMNQYKVFISYYHLSDSRKILDTTIIGFEDTSTKKIIDTARYSIIRCKYMSKKDEENRLAKEEKEIRLREEITKEAERIAIMKNAEKHLAIKELERLEYEEKEKERIKTLANKGIVSRMYTSGP